MAVKLGIQTYQILTNDDEVCIPSLSSILLAVLITFSLKWHKQEKKIIDPESKINQSFIPKGFLKNPVTLYFIKD